MIPFLKKNKDGRKPPKSTVPRTAQESIPFQRMFEDGTCRVRPGYYTRTIQYQDINYEPYYFAFIIPIFFSLSTTTKGLCPKSRPKYLDSFNCICYNHSINCISSKHSCVGG